MKNNKKYAIIICVIGLILLLVGVTYSFFNYTRTGSANTVSVGNISFNSTQGPAISLSNVFPIDRDDIDTDTDNVGTVTINVTGSTDYTHGVEYLISAVDVVNTSGTTIYDIQKVPIGVDVSFSANGTGKTIGTENANYFNEGVRGGDTSYYKIIAGDTIKNSGPLVVGYIAPGETGIDGNLVIKAFVDDSQVAISDTYPAGSTYIVNPNMTQSMIDDCVNYLTSIGWVNFLREGETLVGYCEGNGTVDGSTMQQDYDYGIPQRSRLNYFISHNFLVYTGDNGTDTEWANGRTIITTSNWSGLELSFKIRVEANEGIWVDDLGKIATCPNCQFMYYELDDDEENYMYTTWNMAGYDEVNDVFIPETPSVITSGLSDSYLDIVNNQNTETFFGLILNESNQVTRLYFCFLKDEKPLCLEATEDGSSYSSNLALLQSEEWWNNTCESTLETNLSGDFTETTCNQESMYYPKINIHDHGCVESYVFSYTSMSNRLEKMCDADRAGAFFCQVY